MKETGNKGFSTVFGAILFITLVLAVASVLFAALYRYNSTAQAAIIAEEERMREKIAVYRLETQNQSGTEYIRALYVKNIGSVACRIRAVYVDNSLVFDPSDGTVNPSDTFINPRESRTILVPSGIVFNPTSKLTVTTERGTRSTEYEWKLKHGYGSPPPYEIRFYFGPLMLDFDRFYYTECDPQDGSYDPLGWKPGWQVEIGTGTIVWNITVRNVDDRNITINQFSCFTLFPNKGGSGGGPGERRAWYLEPPSESFSQFIPSNHTVNIIYIWTRPKMERASPQNIYATVCRNKVFLTFFGIFHEHDGTTKPYGQTIPFEAVLCIPPPLTVSASPTVLVDSSMTATISATLYDAGIPTANANVSFATNLGNLSAHWANANTDGVATVTLYFSATPGTATVTATWGGLSASTRVVMNAIPIAQFTESAHTVNTNETVDLVASDSYDPDGNIVSWVWDFGDGVSANGVTTGHRYADDGIYIVTLTVTDDRGARASQTANKTVLNRLPLASFTVNATTPPIGGTIRFDASGSYDPDGSIVSYLWDFGDGSTGGVMTIDHSYANPGDYIVTLKVTDDDGGNAEDYRTITVGGG